jgi:hypothetical protein
MTSLYLLPLLTRQTTPPYYAYKRKSSKVKLNPPSPHKCRDITHSFILCCIAISLELTGQLEQAVDTYDEVVDMIGKATETTDRSMVDWCEEALYRGSLLLLGHR